MLCTRTPVPALVDACVTAFCLTAGTGGTLLLHSYFNLLNPGHRVWRKRIEARLISVWSAGPGLHHLFKTASELTSSVFLCLRDKNFPV